MSTYYKPTETIPLNEIKKLKEFEVIVEKEEGKKLFFDGTNYLHFQDDGNDNVTDILRYGGNNPNNILDALESNFKIRMIDEYDERYFDLAPSKSIITIETKEG